MLPLRHTPCFSRAIRHSIHCQVRCYTHSRVPNYDGWWTLILHRKQAPSLQHQETYPHEQRKPLAIPTQDLSSPALPTPPPAPPKQHVTLKGKSIELPEKPPPPDTCCMSGCAVCVWDLYEEDMQEYQAKKQEIRDMFEEAGEPLPASLKRSNKSVIEEMEDEMDPTMKAFRAMERKLKS
ncbi:hypothetical protein LRAMOSA03414 [Lichtheimia ramosa]|uniref:Oxidoreductase-like domain-containing protein n=1 Tax=Lichtheimia ramosa TaxID=688394 RepID=A0A077WU78_9FUNG|nr:hypothetical protein LRAMOSA03414 [Lichtheimia ramosa]